MNRDVFAYSDWQYLRVLSLLFWKNVVVENFFETWLNHFWLHTTQPFSVPQQNKQPNQETQHTQYLRGSQIAHPKPAHHPKVKGLN